MLSKAAPSIIFQVFGMTQPRIELQSPGPLVNTLLISQFPNGPGDWGSIPGQVIPKTQKMVLDASLLNTQHYKIWIKGKVEQSRKSSNALPYLSVVAIEKRAFGSPSTIVANFTYLYSSAEWSLGFWNINKNGYVDPIQNLL